MDLCYFEAPPGLQFLHCLEMRKVDGGESTFVDSYHAVELLTQKDPRAVDILASIKIPYHYYNNGHRMVYWRSVLVDNSSWNCPSRYDVNYAPPFQAPLSLTQFSESKYAVRDWYAAMHKFTEILESPAMLYKVKLREGECAVFANRRVLHGRTSFEVGEGGMRLLRGTYVDWDMFMDKHRSLVSPTL